MNIRWHGLWSRRIPPQTHEEQLQENGISEHLE